MGPKHPPELGSASVLVKRLRLKNGSCLIGNRAGWSEQAGDRGNGAEANGDCGRHDQQHGVRSTQGFLHTQMSLFINHGWRCWLWGSILGTVFPMVGCAQPAPTPGST